MSRDAASRGRAEEDSSRPSRRGFLRGAGIAAAASGVGAAAGAGGAFSTAPDAAASGLPAGLSGLRPRLEGPGYDHVVCVMFENRSFDTLLGYLYSPEHGGGELPPGRRFEGIPKAGLRNTAPDGTVVEVHPYSGPTDRVMSSPDPDPGEEFPFVNTQLYDAVLPAANRQHRIPTLLPPYNAPPEGTPATMDGFVRDYVLKFETENRREPTVEEYRQILGCFTPPMLPVLSTLARSFAVYDHWHAAVPSQTYPNRSFFHASSSNGWVTNAFDPGIAKWLDPEQNTAVTIFNRLEEAGVPWCVYYDDRQLVSLTGVIHEPHLRPYWKTRFRTMSRFWEDTANGTLPAYSFIEPRLVFDHNDMHPPVGPNTRGYVDGDLIEGSAISDIRAGDALLHSIYTAIRESASPTGSNAMNTTFLITFDEHGGTYDHVPPPEATPPALPERTEMDFAFDRLGVRVPAIVVSAYTAPGTVVNQPMHHGSLIATLCERWGLDPLTARDLDAPTIRNALNLTVPRDPATWPTTFPLYRPPNPENSPPEEGKDDDRPLSPPGAGLMALLVEKFEPGQPVPTTYADAWALIHRYGDGLFGR
ncbi:MAG: hypothetical protein HY996_04340 [Micrococcales bacterium]|nr:hypothetical protein [Micrococcales bacterium]